MNTDKMETGVKHILLFAMSILLALTGCEKAEISPAEPDETTPGISITIPDTIKRNTNERDGSLDKPFTAGDLATGSIGLYIRDNDIELNGYWVEGYIVGYVAGTSIRNAIFDTGDMESNIILADNLQENTYSNTIPIQLSSNKSYVAVRQALNLCDNPHLLHRKVKVCGTICDYMSTIGVKHTRDHYLINEWE